jgi:fused signal recognition particle receptor
MDNTSSVLLVAAIIFFGIVCTVIYYFARYYFRTHMEDQEVLGKPADITELGSKDIDLTKNWRRDGQSSGPGETTTVPAEKAEPVAAPPVKRKSLQEALEGTKASFWGKVKFALGGRETLTTQDVDALEEVLFTSDLGPQTAQVLFERVGNKLKSNEKSDLDKVKEALKAEITQIFETDSTGDDDRDLFASLQVQVKESKPIVWMVVGVNGVGKTTTIGKLASKAQALGLKSMIVAGDTFRAAADAQLRAWAERAGCEYFSTDATKDPSAVAYQGIEKARSLGVDLVIVDTAGRLHTQDNLMEELRKMKRVMTKVVTTAPEETILVIDANSGQNALEQARQFHKALELTGVILTKLDGTSKGGVAVGLVHELKIPIRFIGVGEGIEDLRPFKAQEFVDAIL